MEKVEYGLTPSIRNALPFTVGFAFIPLMVAGVVFGGWWLLLAPGFGWLFSSVIDYWRGRTTASMDPMTESEDLSAYRLVTLLWVPTQLALIFFTVVYAAQADHLSWYEKAFAMFGLGVASGGVGINFAHEMMHQKNRVERWGADLLMTSVLYGHFRSEHLLVHHRYVGTSRDPVTARYNEGFHHFFWRVLPECFISAWQAEAAKLQRVGKSKFDLSNPFWLYACLQLTFLGLAFVLGGWVGTVLFILQAFVAIGHLELINYIEHYGLAREHLGDGKYEHVKPHHSWNTDYEYTNYLLINLQRHSDHHYKPDRRFPLLQTYDFNEAPRLPYGYPIMAAMAFYPAVWKRNMNKRVDKWRARFYPHISDWTAYEQGTNPLPR
ncbi:MAG: alkane 1-monooxygenase [Pseudomonadota bacterium]